jgi:hypothetical protein
MNVSCNKRNFAVLEIAECLKDSFSNIEIDINENAEPDKLSYKVDFPLYESLTGDTDSYPTGDLTDSIG